MSYYKILHIPTGQYLKETCVFYLDDQGSVFADSWDTYDHIMERACTALRPGGSTLYMFDRNLKSDPAEFLRVDIVTPDITEEDEYGSIYTKEQIECLYYTNTELNGKII